MTNATEFISSVPLGTHFCAFNRTREELAGALGPYFAGGIRREEFCFWVTSDPSGVESAKTELRKAAPYLDRYLDTGQIEIWDHRDWYLRGGHFDADRVYGQWLDRMERALGSGYKGLRASGEVAWLDKRDWPGFMEYEAEANRVIAQHRMIGLCTYPLDRCTGGQVLEVVHNHRFALGQIDGEWGMIDTSNSKAASDALGLNGNLHDETSLSERLQQLSARLLSQQDEERRWVADQLHEGSAQNLYAIAMYLASLQQQTSTCSSEIGFILAKCRMLCEQSLEQILTLSYRLHPPAHDRLDLAARLQSHIEDLMKRSQIHIGFETGPEIGRLPLEMETHLFRIAQEGLSNVLRHSRSLKALVRLSQQADRVILEIEDFGRGMPAMASRSVSGAPEAGLGILGMQVRLQQIGGRLEIQSSPRGTILTASVPVP